MSNKLKSLIYLSCFMIAAVVYHVDASNKEETKLIDSSQTTEADITINPFMEDIGE